MRSLLIALLILSGISRSGFAQHVTTVTERSIFAAPHERLSDIKAPKRLATIIDDESRRSPTKAELVVFGATGFMECPPQPFKGGRRVRVTVQLTGKPNLVTTVAHAVCNYQWYEPKKDLEQCSINFPLLSLRTYRINVSTLRIGACFGDVDRYRKDWAVFELNAEVPDAKVYAIPEVGYVVPLGTQIVQVAALAHNFNPTKPATDISYYNIQSCNIRDRSRYDSTLQTDCDVGKGSSGAGQFVFRDGKPLLISINTAEAKAIYGFVSGTPYHPERNYNSSVPMEADLLNAVHRFLVKP